MIPDLVAVALIAAGCALVVAATGLLVLRALRRRSLVLSLTVVALVSVGSVVAGALGTAAAMFLSRHDLGVLVIVSAVAGTVGVLTAVLLGRAVVSGSRALGVAAASIGGGYLTVGDLPAELAALDRQLGEASARLEQSHARERALEASRRELVAWVSHDLRTPLAGIRAMAEALEDGVVQDEGTVHEYHAGMRREADRLSVMVDDLFELSRINAAALDLTFQEVSLADVVSDALASASPVAAAKGVRLRGEAPAHPLPVQASTPELGRVLRNLLSNAIRHTPADGVVSVQIGADATSAFVAVHDACGGIPAEDLPRVFDVAFRGTTARTPGAEGGAGLGLAIARGLVEAHHGQISVENDGPGCRVLVRLPAGAAAS